MQEEHLLIAQPYAKIDELLEQKASAKQVSEYFHERLKDSWEVIPCLNTMATPNTLVRYRCILQDMNNAELFTRNCMFREVQEDDCNEIDYSSLMERHLFYCVPVPGESEWSRSTFYGPTALPSVKSNEKSKRKRSSEDEDTDDSIHYHNGDNCQHHGIQSVLIGKGKKMRDEESLTTVLEGSSSSTTREEMLDFPVKGERGLACFVKVYDEDPSYKTAQIIDFVGVLTYQDQSHLMETGDDCDFQTFAPDAALVPRLHVLFSKSHKTVFDLVIPRNHTESITTVRSALIKHFTNVLSGDALTAELLLLHLLSRVRSYNYDVTLGKFALNIFDCDDNFASNLYPYISEIVPASHLLHMENENLNSIRLAPVKDYDTDKLKAGLLQLAPGTHLIVNENALKEGNLFESAIHNISALSLLIQSQKVNYDFSYPVEMHVDIPVLIVSKGKTLFKTNNVTCMVKYSPKAGCNSVVSTDENMILLFREYIAYVVQRNDKDIKLSNAAMELAQNAFVNARARNAESVTDQTLHNWLTIAELVHLSFGNFDNELDVSSWNRAIELDSEKEGRV